MRLQFKTEIISLSLIINGFKSLVIKTYHKKQNDIPKSQYSQW